MTAGWICTKCGTQSTRCVPLAPTARPLCVACRQPVEMHRIDPKMGAVETERYEHKVGRMTDEALVAERRRVTGSNIMSDRDLHMAAILMASYATRFGPSVHFWQAPVTRRRRAWNEHRGRDAPRRG
jgi:hypothetical protein